MDQSSQDIYWKEAELLCEAKDLLQEIGEDGCIEASRYAELLHAYAALLKQTSKLTRLSDRDQKRLNNLLERLSRLVSPPLYRKITSGKEKLEINQTKRVKLTIFFSDIVNFSAHSLNMEGEALSNILNSYLEEMTNIVNIYGGTLDKYIGDAVMVFFGDPDFTDDFDHAYRCVQMAIAMRQKMDDMQQQWFKLGYSDPLHIRMGIATGFVTAGAFGSSERLDYTIIGSAVNLASRLQTAANEDQILISHDTWGLVKNQIRCKDGKRLKLKGFSKLMLAYEVQGLVSDSETSEVMIEDKEKGLLIRYDKSKTSPEEVVKLIRC
ncbi:MAG: adenylate/guanylate cyclase domain-containing protein [Candidatus Cloacimonas sp.]|nr:adenylate/guanylate cyclase domain-containing protein [Candidatus Cloacimonas sp.]